MNLKPRLFSRKWTVKLPELTYQAAASLAREGGMSLSAFIREVLEEKVLPSSSRYPSPLTARPAERAWRVLAVPGRGPIGSGHSADCKCLTCRATRGF